MVHDYTAHADLNMAIRSDPTRQRYPGITGRMIVDTFRGQVRVRSWPRKRGKKATPLQRLWRDWFASAQERAKYAPASQWEIAIKMARGTGLYPRDILTKAMGTGFYDAIDENGDFNTKRWDFWEPVMYQGVSTYRDTNLVVPGGVATIPQWPLPEIDTMSFWDMSDQTIFTIPEHVEVVQLGFAIGQTDVVNANVAMYIFRNGTELIARADQIGNQRHSNGVVTTPLVVSQGETFHTEIFSTAGLTIDAGPGFNFWLNALQVQ